MTCVAALVIIAWATLAPSLGAAHPSSAERVDILTRRIAAAPGDPRPLVARGAIHGEEGHFDLALADFAAAEDLGGPLVVAYERAVLHRRKGEYALARMQLEALLEKVPGHAPALEEQARVLSELGQVEAAVAAFERLFEMQYRPNPGIYLSAAQLLASTEEGGVDRALTLLDAGLDRLGIVPQLQHYAIELELRRGEDQQALARLQRLGPALGEGPEWMVDMATLLQRMNRKEESRAMLSSASAKLDELRDNPARRRLRARISLLESGREESTDDTNAP